MLLSFSSQSFFFTNSSSSTSSISPRLIRVALVRVSRERVFLLSKNTPRPLTLSLFLSLSVFFLRKRVKVSALYHSPHDESSMTRRSALRRKDIESMMRDFNACKPTKNFGTRLFKDDARVYATITPATAFVQQRRRLYRARGKLVCGTNTEMHSRRVSLFLWSFSPSRSTQNSRAEKHVLNSSWYVSLLASLSRFLSLSKLLFVRNERTNLVRARIERERGERAFANINLLLFSFSPRVDLRCVLRAFALALARETVWFAQK